MLLAANAAGQGTVASSSGAGGAESPAVQRHRTAADATIFNRRDARTITLAIPAPRGLITDRDGEPLAQSRVAWQLALMFPQFETDDRDYIVAWARARVERAKDFTPKAVDFTDEQLFEHYRHRRWLPLYVSGLLDEAEVKEIESKQRTGLVLHPVYARTYPEKELAAHIIGYSGSVGKLPTGPINFNEPLWEMSEGRAGLEKLFDRELTGQPGTKRLLFDSDGSKLLEEQTKRPVPGGTLVTTLRLKWQRLAEEVLRERCRRGAFVVLDVVTGEVLVMASRPSFDLNRFIPGISEADYKALQDDEGRPLFGRAFQSGYPPASAFKPVVALAALNNGTVTENSTVYCPAAIRIGNHVFNNWSRVEEGSINVKRAIARSCNPWFYQVGIDVGPSAFLGLARRLGFGSTSQLPLIGETPGLVPTNDWMRENQGRPILDGDTANMAIGQGVLLASPLQVAQAMAGIANGGALPKLHLVRQVHGSRGRVVQASLPERRNWLGLDPEVVKVVHKGMRDVVNSGFGTGGSAGLSYTELCGKTGTAQWGPKAKNQRLAWFAGFLPYDNPRYAFAALYEGRPNEKLSGGRNAGPMVRAFFEPLKSEIKEETAPPPKAVVVVDTGEGGEEGILRAIPVDPESLEQEPEAGGDDESGDNGARDGGVIRSVPAQPTPGGARVEPLRPAEPEPEAPRALPVDPDNLPEDPDEENL